MNTPRKLARCAIYTRKSTEHNLDMDFNSLDAQREACEAYIKSQAHEGWRLVPDQFDDGGISGASLERPALQGLLSEIQAGRVDIVVVYKVDRLTRSLTDFAKLVELFDRHGVSFVSITQSFNTTTSMGRLTLNILLSFAQFEREVIGERVRDKIAASKRKGIWVGGPVPLGYASVNKKIVILPDEAETVRGIFRRYLELGAVRALAADLDRRGIRSKRRDLANGQTVGGGRFGVGALSHFLKNRFYIGEIAYHGEIHQGEHEPILDHALFEEVQAKLAANNVERQLKLKSSPAILTGRIYDDRGNRMTPSHATKNGVRYRYYVSNAIQQNRNGQAGSVCRVPAPEIEDLVTQAVHAHYALKGDSSAQGDGLLAGLERAVLTPDSVQVHIAPCDSLAATGSPIENDGPLDDQGRPAVIISVPWQSSAFVAVKGVVAAPAKEAPNLKAETRDALLAAIANARSWVDELATGRTATIAKIAKREGKVERHVRLLLPLAFVAPTVVEGIAEGASLANMTVTGLAKAVALSWNAQRQIYI